MSHRQPRLKDQARALRETLASKGMELGQGESLELVAKLNGYPSWNVASKADKAPAAPVGTTLKFELWTAIHHHRHGEDLFFFTHCPSEDEVIERIEEKSSWEPDADEYIEIGGVEKFDIDVPLEMVKAAAAQQPPKVLGVYEVCMPDFFAYDTPDQLPEWKWVERQASFAHKGNGVEGGVWEFMVYLPMLQDDLHDIPAMLLPHVKRAIELGAVWVMFHQG